MNHKLFCLVAVLVLSAMLVLNLGYVQAQTPGQIPMFGQPLTGFCNSAGGNDCIDSVITQGANGNIGIGTTGPGVKLHLAGTDEAGYAATIQLQNQNAGGANAFITASDSFWTAGANKLLFGLGATGPFSDNVKMAIDSSGNVGIGTTTPTSKVEISAQDGLAITGFQPFLTLRDANAGNLSGFIQSVEGHLIFIPNSFAGGGAAMVIRNTTGNVGIGTATPTAKLDVAGDIAIGTGVNSNGGGLKHLRFRVNGITPGEHVFPLTWPSSFPDANYTVNAVVEDLNPNLGTQLFMRDVLRKTAAGLQVFIVNDSGFTKNADVHVIAIHD